MDQGRISRFRLSHGLHPERSGIHRTGHNQLRLVDGQIPVYPGIGQWRLSADRTVGQIHYARQLGAPGFTIFNLDSESIESAVPAIGLGVGRQQATPPHGEEVMGG